MNATLPALIEIRTSYANGERVSVIVPARAAGVAFRGALAREWKQKTCGYVEAIAAR